MKLTLFLISLFISLFSETGSIDVEGKQGQIKRKNGFH